MSKENEELILDCKICGYQSKNLKGKHLHISNKHHVNRDAYYEMYENGLSPERKIKNALESKWDPEKTVTCKICGSVQADKNGFSTHYAFKHKTEMSLSEYYKRYHPEYHQSGMPIVGREGEVYCELCNWPCKNQSGISRHLMQKHRDLSQQDFYDKFRKKPDEGICLVCHAPTAFISLKGGYKKCCSDECVYEHRSILRNEGKGQYAHLGGGNRMVKYTTKFGDEIYYQSKLELKFVKLCEQNNVRVVNGDTIPYIKDNKKHRYHVDFKIQQESKWRLIEIKGNHLWFQRALESGDHALKMNVAIAYSKEKEYLPFICMLEKLYIPELTD